MNGGETRSNLIIILTRQDGAEIGGLQGVSESRSNTRREMKREKDGSLNVKPRTAYC
jgi:hypothetical protein